MAFLRGIKGAWWFINWNIFPIPKAEGFQRTNSLVIFPLPKEQKSPPRIFHISSRGSLIKASCASIVMIPIPELVWHFIGDSLILKPPPAMWGDRPTSGLVSLICRNKWYSSWSGCFLKTNSSFPEVRTQLVSKPLVPPFPWFHPLGCGAEN